MFCEIKEVSRSDVKSQICNDILRSIPKWFGNEEAIIDYAKITQNMPFYAAYDGEKIVGFVAIKIHNSFTAEVCVMGIMVNYHRQGIGTRLIGICEEYCAKNKMLFLTVKTLDASANFEPYEKTRKFYNKMGFVPLDNMKCLL